MSDKVDRATGTGVMRVGRPGDRGDKVSNTRALNETFCLIMMATFVLLLTLIDENGSGKYF